MSHELDIPEFLRVSNRSASADHEYAQLERFEKRHPIDRPIDLNRVEVIASQITTKPIEQVVNELIEEPVDLTVEIKAMAISAHLNYLIWLKQQVEAHLPTLSAFVTKSVGKDVDTSKALTSAYYQKKYNEARSVGKQDGRGHHYAGKMWMLNRKTGERARIAPNELEQFKARGFVCAGPRSK